MPEKTRRPIGRPTKYDPSFCDLIIEEMGKGYSLDAASVRIGVNASSLYLWQQQHPDFSKAIEEGRRRALQWWEDRALNVADGKPGNQQMISLALRNRSRAANGWVDTQKLEHSGPDGSPIQTQNTLDVSVLNSDQLDALMTALEASFALKK
jgi:transposase-like protein